MKLEKTCKKNLSKKLRKKLIYILAISILTLGSLTACGKVKDPVIEETQQGIQLEDKAREVTGQQKEQAEDADSKLENTPGE